MTVISVRDLDDRVAARLKMRAARNGRSMEAEVRAILADAVTFDARPARRHGSLVVEREDAGRPIATADAQIAAIGATRGATLATRNTGDCQGTGIDLVNPWDG